MNFLIVEDDNIQLTGLKYIIEEEYADAVVNTASTYNDAITIIDSFDIDIFLLDIDVINKYHCQYYFSKPYDRIDVVGGINSVLTQPDDQTSRIRVKDIQGILFHISMDEIIYVCASGHHKHIFTSDGDFIVTNPTFESILQDAGDASLVRCHKSYYFNPNYIQSYDRSNSLIKLKLTQESIPVGRKYKTIIETYQEYR